MEKLKLQGYIHGVLDTHNDFEEINPKLELQFEVVPINNKFKINWTWICGYNVVVDPGDNYYQPTQEDYEPVEDDYFFNWLPEEGLKKLRREIQDVIEMVSKVKFD
jgi:hypothetical protein